MSFSKGQTIERNIGLKKVGYIHNSVVQPNSPYGTIIYDKYVHIESCQSFMNVFTFNLGYP